MQKKLEARLKQMDRRFIWAAWFLDSIREIDFLRTVETLLDGISMSFNVHYCDFPRPWNDPPFEGVKFGLDLIDQEQELIVSYDQFLVFLKMAAELYLEDHPADREPLRALFAAKGIDYDVLSLSLLKTTEA